MEDGITVQYIAKSYLKKKSLQPAIVKNMILNQISILRKQEEKAVFLPA